MPPGARTLWTSLRAWTMPLRAIHQRVHDSRTTSNAPPAYGRRCAAPTRKRALRTPPSRADLRAPAMPSASGSSPSTVSANPATPSANRPSPQPRSGTRLARTSSSPPHARSSSSGRGRRAEEKAGTCLPTSPISSKRLGKRLVSGLLEPDQVARRVAERAIPDAVRLVHRLLQHLAATLANVLERRVAVVRAEVDAAEQALGEQLLHDLAVGRRRVRVGERRLEDAVDVGLALGPDRGPPRALVLDVIAGLEAEEVAVEGQRLVVVVDGDEAVAQH